MTTSTNKKGLRKHMNQIVNSSHWEGIDMTLRKWTVTTDPNGKPIGRSSVDVTITGIISSDSEKVMEAAGQAQDRKVQGLFVWPADHGSSLIPVIEDRIIETVGGTTRTYIVVEIPYISWDIDDPVLIITQLREIPNET